jgi:hypothetical protein
VTTAANAREIQTERERVMKYVLAITVFVAAYTAHAAGAQPASLERPVKLRVTGTLLPVEEQRRDDLVTVSIVVRDEPLLLRVGRVEELTRTEREQTVKWGVLLRQVRFYGPDALLERIQGPKAMGKAFTIEGQLDTRGRQFLVTAVKEVPDIKPQHPKDE